MEIIPVSRIALHRRAHSCPRTWRVAVPVRFTPLLALISLETAGGHSAALQMFTRSNCLNITAAYPTEKILLTRLTIIVRTFLRGKTQEKLSAHSVSEFLSSQRSSVSETMRPQTFPPRSSRTRECHEASASRCLRPDTQASQAPPPGHHNLVWRGQSPYPLPPAEGASSRPFTVTAARSASAPSP